KFYFSLGFLIIHHQTNRYQLFLPYELLLPNVHKLLLDWLLFLQTLFQSLYQLPFHRFSVFFQLSQQNQLKYFQIQLFYLSFSSFFLNDSRITSSTANWMCDSDIFFFSKISNNSWAPLTPIS